MYLHRNFSQEQPQHRPSVRGNPSAGTETESLSRARRGKEGKFKEEETVPPAMMNSLMYYR